ncbi:MAG: polyhydroxyalkanoate synthesis regulator DNA-binding domain-containing protein [Deltaproteobacteria bacterium]|nr:polyhydroxyalkanoate synthesis regulator DNA-binding domain-containing protein [Deltaproteobacteria bacterium]
MAEARVIKRYANRKLYDTQRSRYVTLDQIAEMIRGGEDVNIVDNTTKEDLTSITLAQIIFEEEKKQKSFLPLHAMRNIIQSGGERIEELVSQAQRRVTGVFSRRSTADTQAAAAGGEPEPASAPAPAVEEQAPEASKASEVEAHRDGVRALREFREWIENSQRTIDEWQKKVDERIRHVVEGISPFASLQKDVAALSARMVELEKKLEQLATDADGGVES